MAVLEILKGIQDAVEVGTIGVLAYLALPAPWGSIADAALLALLFWHMLAEVGRRRDVR